jgi:AraC-like DNA-binding protein
MHIHVMYMHVLSGVLQARRPLNRGISEEMFVTDTDSRCGYPPSSIADRDPCPAWVARIMAGENESGHRGGTAAQQELVTNAKRYISNHPTQRIRLADVGQALGVSPVYVTDVFRQVEGVPLYQYALRKRLERAVRLLPGYHADLSTLALELDFASHSHFTTAFGQAFGCTPAVFRERARRVCRNITSSASRRVEIPNQSVAAHPAPLATA